MMLQDIFEIEEEILDLSLTETSSVATSHPSSSESGSKRSDLSSHPSSSQSGWERSDLSLSLLYINEFLSNDEIVFDERSQWSPLRSVSPEKNVFMRPCEGSFTRVPSCP